MAGVRAGVRDAVVRAALPAALWRPQAGGPAQGLALRGGRGFVVRVVLSLVLFFTVATNPHFLLEN